MYIDFLSQMCYTVCRLNSVTDMCKRCEIPTSKTKQKKRINIGTREISDIIVYLPR